MNDVIILGLGCFVSLVVACAVGLLLWGASNEPRGEIMPGQQANAASPSSRPTPSAPALAQSLESKSPA